MEQQPPPQSVSPEQPVAAPVSAQLPPQNLPIAMDTSASKNSFLPYLLAVVTLILGVAGGFFLAQSGNTAKHIASAPVKSQKDFKLPLDAVEIQQCATEKGALYARPQNVPGGPVFMVHNGKVVGIEYMVEKNEFLKGEGMKYLSAKDATVDHVNVGILEEGHAGFPGQHFHVDLYTISRQMADAITCPGGSDEQMAMPGMDMGSTPSATPSVTNKMEMNMKMNEGTPAGITTTSK
jgi:hypothetical protein